MAARGLGKHYQGSKWITRERRLAIYLRDGLACAYCGSTLEDGTLLTLDHLMPYREGGSTQSQNLITCCRKCNSSRGQRTLEAFAAATAAYLNHDITAEMIVDSIREKVSRAVDLNAAKALIAARGSFVNALNRS
jgi:hypothetical protein